MKKMAFALVCACVQAFGCATASAGLQLGATRLIYPAGEKSVTLMVANPDGKTPYLVQPVVVRALNDSAAAPFVVNPPLFRLEPGGENAVRVVKLPANLPADKESLFWLNVRGIPAGNLPPGGEINQAAIDRITGKGAIALSVIIKLIYRPGGLSGASASGGMLKVLRSPRGVKLENPTPFIISLASLDVGGHHVLSASSPVMAKTVAPFSAAEITFSGLSWPAGVKWQTINDAGGTDAWQGKGE